MADTGAGPAQSADALFAEVYARLKSMARRHLGAFQGGAPLDATVLVHELYLRMSAQGDVAFTHPGQFFSYAAQAMRHLLLDLARSHRSLRAGGDWMQVTLTASDESLVLESAEHMIALDGAIDRLAEVDARAARVIELRYFAGLTAEEAAEALGISKRTADRDFEFAHAYLKTDLG
jgi:RNA polymerase sigma factor (TIGR02999 family)